uniref:Proannomuricatin EF n=1 Tax=Annona muricata TaxID=13337 RepID=A0A5B9T7H5_ANNMU|nr:proannomuricatin EF [Annona muricata]
MDSPKSEGLVTVPSVAYHHTASGLFLHTHQLPNSEGLSAVTPGHHSSPDLLISVHPCQA